MSQKKEEILAERIKGVETELKDVNRRLECNDSAHLRIEDKIDKLPEKLAEQFAPKSVVEKTEELNKSVKNLNGRFWAVLITGSFALLGVTIWMIETWLKYMADR